MKKLQNWLQGMSIATKQFVFLFVISLIMFLTLAIFNLREAEEIFGDQVIEDAEILMTRTADMIEIYLDNVNNIILLLSSSQEMLLDDNEQRTLQTLRRYVDSSSSVIGALYLIRSDGKVFSSNQTYFEIMGHPKLEELTRLSKSNYGAISVSEPYQSPLAGRTVAYTRPIMNERNQYVGTAVLEINLRMLYNRIAPLLSDRHQTFLMITKSGEPVSFLDTKDELLPYKPAVFPPALTDGFAAYVEQLPVGVWKAKGAGGRNLVTVKSAYNRLGWSVVLFIEESYFNQSTQKLYSNFRSVGAVWILVLLFSSYLLSRYFTSPIRALVQRMDHSEGFKAVMIPTTRRRDEIGRLVSSYNDLMLRIQGLIRDVKEIETRKKETEMKMLQSQIAPHFLYNTLAGIGSLAKQGKIGEVRETIKSLVGLLSFSFDRISAIVTLRDELEMLRMYAYVQKIRYGDKFSIVEQVEPDSLNCPILKLTLQPLIENAIFHGLAPLKTHGTITIRSFIRNGDLKIYISDNGVGMKKETVGRILTEPASQALKPKFTSIGVRNVHERIQLHYGEAYGIKIGSVYGKGTVVRISIPCTADYDG